jgi:hypothetical protein
MGYSLDDEISAYMQGIEHALENISEYESSERPDEQIDDLIEQLQAMREPVAEGRDDT